MKHIIIIAGLCMLILIPPLRKASAQQPEKPDPDELSAWTGWIPEADAALKKINRKRSAFKIADHTYWRKRREGYVRSGTIDPKLPLPQEQDPARFPAIDAAMDDPFSLPAYGYRVHRGLSKKPSFAGILTEAAKLRMDRAPLPVFIPPKTGLRDGENVFLWLWRASGRNAAPYIAQDLERNWAAMPQELKEACTVLVPAIYQTHAIREGILAALPEDAKRAISDYRRKDVKGLITLIEASKKVEMSKVLDMGLTMAFAMDRATPALNKTKEKNYGRFRYLFETPLGVAIISGSQNDYYTRDAFLVIDIGGDDLYANSAGGASPSGKGVSVCIDLEGDDVYSSGEDFVQGAACLGVGILADMGGSDKYLADSYAQGCGFLGTGILFDTEGNDRRAAEIMCQGAGYFGFGIHIDGSGSDNYVASAYAQGCGRMLGVGICCDIEGNDKYFAGGRYRDTSRHANTYMSQSQGYGEGFFLRKIEQGRTTRIHRLYPGGIGILYDRSGNDSYRGQVFCQGMGYFYAMGICMDIEGNDSYEGYWYSQGASAHFAVGACFDFSGDDTYRTPHQALGNGRDFSQALFFDGGGNDRYNADERSIGSGDLRNGFGIFVDLSGSDSYSGKTKCLGFGTPNVNPPEYVSLGLFLDLGGGKDEYKVFPAKERGLGADNSTWEQRGFGIGIDR